MVWDYDLETRHAGIDQDHQEVVAYLTAFLKMLDSGHTDRVPGVLAAFHERVAKHFEYEDGLMRDITHAGLRDHVAAHQAFLADVQRARDGVGASGVTEAFRQWAHGRMVSWFRFHIKAYDMALAKSLLEHGAGSPPSLPQL